MSLDRLRLLTSHHPQPIANVQGGGGLGEGVPGDKENEMILLKVVAKLAEAADETNNKDIDICELDNPDHEESTSSGESKADGLDH